MWCKSLEVLNPYEALKEANMPDLKPCPFCGSMKIKDRERKKGTRREVWIQCHVCNARTGVYEGMIYEPYKNLKAEAIEAWNRRAGEEDKHEQEILHRS